MEGVLLRSRQLKRSWSDRMRDEVTRFLVSVPVPTEGNSLLEILEDLGVETPSDIQLVTEEDLMNSGLSVIQRRKVLRRAATLPATESENNSFPISHSQPVPLPVQPATLHTPSTTQPPSCSTVVPSQSMLYSFNPVQDTAPFQQCAAHSITPPPIDPRPMVTDNDSQPDYDPQLMLVDDTTILSHTNSPPSLTSSIVSCPANHSTLKYIFCSDRLFVQRCEQKIVIADLEKDSMEFLSSLILTNEGLPQDTTSVELFTHEGYPIPLNQYSRHVPLKLWEVADGDLFYAFPRPKLQPSWSSDDDYPPPPGIHDPYQGTICLNIYCELMINLMKIYVDLPCSLGVIIDKVATCSGISTNAISLSMTPNRYDKITDSELLGLEDGDTLIMRVDLSSSSEAYYGKETYVPMNKQSDTGLSKFYSILMYLVHNSKLCPPIVQYLREHTSCPPLAYAFHLLHQERCIVNLPHVVALFEGFYCLTNAVIQSFCKVPSGEVLEYCDYVFGLILGLTKGQEPTDDSVTCSEQLVCPITNTRLLRPVTLPTGSRGEWSRVYERLYVEKKIRAREDILYCDAQDLQLSDVQHSPESQRLLMLSDNTNSYKVWKNLPSTQECIGVYTVPCDWKTLAVSHKHLEVCAPDALSMKSYVLTYITEGRIVLYTECTKSAQISKQVYDPLCSSNKYKEFTAAKMRSFKRSSKKVFRDISQSLLPQFRASSSARLVADPSLAVKDKQKVGEITRVPEEAIMVLLDTSGSMSETVFKEEGGMSKLTAAKEYFNAFSNRIEAYGLHQVVALISFSDETTMMIEFTEVMDQFSDVLTDVSCGGGTALYAAILEAADHLEEFTKSYPSCRKRILCLTDGRDTSIHMQPHIAASRLQKEKIVLDTVLITGVSGNLPQKSLSHATGGYCFLPEARQVAHRLFEMESVLTLKDRQPPQNLPGVRSAVEFERYFNLRRFPYNSTNPFDFKSQFVSGLDDHTYCSAGSMVQRAQVVGLLDSTSSNSSGHRLRRLLQEIRHYQSNPHSSFEIFPDQSNVAVWKVLLKAPDDTPYTGGTYLLCAKFPKEYPAEAPDLRFITPIYHCNINSSGRICHPVLGRNYIPSMTVREIFDHVYGLLMAPEPSDPLDSILASEYHSSRTRYEQNARQLTRKHAMSPTWDELKQELTSDEDSGIDESLVCPLSHKVFVYPVTTQYGHTYERSNLLSYLAENDNMDPKAKKPVQLDRIIPNLNMRKLANQYRKSKKQII